jgi:hypothetical protein
MSLPRPNFPPIRTTISPDLDVGSLNGWRCSKKSPAAMAESGSVTEMVSDSKVIYGWVSIHIPSIVRSPHTNPLIGKMVAMTGPGNKNNHVEAASCINAVPSTEYEKAEAPAPASDWKAAAMAASDKSWAAAAKSRYKEVREAAARHYAEEAAAAGKKRATRKKRMSQESIDFLLARAKEPRPVLRVDHEFLDSLKTLTTERREEMRAAKTMVVVNLQALRDWEDDIVRRYHTDGYVEIEVDEEDSDDGKL